MTLAAPASTAGTTAPAVRIVTRADDAGLSPGTNRGILEVVQRGVIRNVSVMVPAPAFAEAAEMFRNISHIAVGLHVTLNSEWSNLRWGPVAPAGRVPSLLDPAGCFHPTTGVSRDHGLRVDEAMIEVKAQLDRARAAGLNPVYLDEHMGVGWVNGLRAWLKDFARREGLMTTDEVPGLPRPQLPQPNVTARFLTSLEQVDRGDYVFVTHPACDSDDVRRLHTPGQPAGVVARDRDAERQMLQSPTIVEAFSNCRLAAVRYTDL